MKTRHQDIEQVKCPQCDAMMKPESVSWHIKTSHERKREVIVFQEPEVATKESMIFRAPTQQVKEPTHDSTEDHKKKRALSYTCDLCGEVLPRKMDLVAHWSRHRADAIKKKREILPEIDGSFKCKHCDRYFPKLTTLKRHISLLHVR